MKTPLLLIVLVALGTLRGPGQARPVAPPAHAAPLLRGDYPDPSLVRVGADYYAVATSSDFVPAFPILHSRDLVHWELAGNIFPQWPGWAAGSFWAPDISRVGATYFVYYAARKRDAGMCVAVATAAAPTGPYTDHGPLVCQADGSIDPQNLVTADGHRFLVWKEDSNSVHRPTHILIQPLSSDGLALQGAPQPLLVNDAAWEGDIVEGPYMIAHGGQYYLFYSGGWCCNSGCNYALGVARSSSPTGPFEKDSANPILASNEVLKCPGHHGMVEDATGTWYALYHAYTVADGEMIGREWGLQAVTWKDGWPQMNQGEGPAPSAPGTHPQVFPGDDAFGSVPNPAWLHRALPL